jgi:hypothetical protein
MTSENFNILIQHIDDVKKNQDISDELTFDGFSVLHSDLNLISEILKKKFEKDDTSGGI